MFFYPHGSNDDDTCYAIITDGTRSKYVYFISSLLSSQGISNDNIHIVHESGSNYHIFMNEYKHHIIINDKKTKTNVYIKTFDKLFNDIGCAYVVFMEDTLLPGADMVSYFKWGKQLMQLDDTVFSISGNNEYADVTKSLNPQVFVKTAQFISSGWMTSKRHYDNVLHNINHMSSWDKQIDEIIHREHYSNVFPHLPRVFDVTNGKKQLSTTSAYIGQYIPVHIFNNYSGSYMNWLLENYPYEIVFELKNVIEYEEYKGIAVYSTNDPTGKLLIYYNEKI